MSRLALTAGEAPSPGIARRDAPITCGTQVSIYTPLQSVSLVRQRQVALAHHCRLACETMHSRFAWIDGGHSVVLTVNSGYE